MYNTGLVVSGTDLVGSGIGAAVSDIRLFPLQPAVISTRIMQIEAVNICVIRFIPASYYLSTPDTY